MLTSLTRAVTAMLGVAVTAGLAAPSASAEGTAVPQVRTNPAPTLSATYAKSGKTSGLFLELHVNRPLGRGSRVRIDGFLARSADRHRVRQFWFVGTKDNGLPLGYFKVHRDYRVTFRFCTKGGRHCLTTSKSIFVRRL